MLWILPCAHSPLNTMTSDSSGLSWNLHVEWSTSTLYVGLMKPSRPLHTLFDYMFFIRLNKCILQALLYSLERSFKHRGLTSGRVLGQASPRSRINTTICNEWKLCIVKNTCKTDMNPKSLINHLWITYYNESTQDNNLL